MVEAVVIGQVAIGGLGWVASKAVEKAIEAGAPVVGGVAGNVADRALADAVRGIRDRFAGLRGLPENHDVARAIRIAQMQALERVVRDYRERTGRRRWFESTSARAFFDGSLEFCRRTVGRCRDLGVTLNLEVTPPLLDAVDGLLAAPPHDGAAAERAAAAGRLAEDAVLEELAAALHGVAIPDAFTEHFRRGDGTARRFLDVFGAYVAEQLKTSPRFRDVFVAGQLATLAELARSGDDAVERLTRRIDAAFGEYRLADLVVQGRSAAHLTLTRRPGRGRLASSELRLLDPFTRSIPMLGRDDALADVRAWLGSGAGISVRGLVGRAGAGKTRFALELCDLLEREGWDAGFVTGEELTRFRTDTNAARWEWEKPTLVVVDYAAALAPQLQPWLAELADHGGHPDRPLRLLLLERHAEPAGGWWETIAGRGWDADSVRALFDPPTPVALAPLSTAEVRRGVFVAMLDRVGAPELAPPPSDREFRERLAAVTWAGEPLFLMMAALTAKQAGLGTALALTRVDAARRVAEHELARIARLVPPAAPAGSVPLVAHLAAYATLRQGLPRAEALDVVEEERDALRRPGAGDPPAVLAWLHEALPGADGAIAPVLPDIVGEAVILRALGEGDRQGAVEAVARCARRAWVPVLATAMRVAQDYAPAWHDPAAGPPHPALAWLDRLVVEAGDDVDRLATLADQVPPSTLVLRERAASWAERLVARRRLASDSAEQTGPAGVAAALNNLSYRLSDLGQHEEALAGIEEAVALYRPLAAAHPDAFRSDLAMSLNNLSTQLSDLGRREEALAAGEEAVALRRALAAARPDAFRPDLAVSLNNLSIQLSNLGRREAALAAGEEAAALYRPLAAARPDAFRADLAMSLTNLSLQLSDLGRREAALAAGEEAAALYRTLAAAHPDAFRPALALSLTNLSIRLSDLGRREAALAAGEEAAALYRPLAAARPDAFRPALANSLNNLSIRLSDLGRHEEALARIEEAVALHRALAAARPDAFDPDLASSLNNLSLRLSGLGRHEEALARIEEAVALRRALAAARPDAFDPDLASSLNNLSLQLSHLSRHEEALAAATKAVTLLRPRFLALPRAFAVWMGTMARRYLAAADQAGQPPDMELLAPIAEALARLDDTDESSGAA